VSLRNKIMQFKVTAVTKDGDTYQEAVEAPDRFAVYRDIRARGDRVIELEEKSLKNLFSLSGLLDSFGTISTDEKVILVRNIAAMLEAGLTTSRALSVMERQSKNKRLKAIIGVLIAEVKRGGTFSSALAKYPNVFSTLLMAMVRAGEESGKLAESLRVVSLQMEHASNLTKKIRGALMYPSIVLIAMVIIGILMLIYVVPTLTQTFQELNADLPVMTEIVITVSNFLVAHSVLSILGIFLTIFGVIVSLRTKSGKRVFDWIIIRIPVIRNIAIETYAARTTRTLSSLLSSGVDMILSLAITRDVVGNVYYQTILAEAEASVTKGGPLSESFSKHVGLYPPLVSEMIAVGEETGRLSDLLKETAHFYEEAIDRQTKDLSTIIEPILMVVIGAAVGFFALAMIAPIYSLSDSL